MTAGLETEEKKCDFFKHEVHYLYHLTSIKGIYPLPEKLQCICTENTQRGQTNIGVTTTINSSQYMVVLSDL